MAFFSKGQVLFESKDFCMRLRQGFERGDSVERMINTAQMQIFESIGIKGEYGIDYLARIQEEFSKDSEMQRVFWSFVHMEEKTLDEAESMTGWMR